jgi:histidine decarboxylase
MKASYKKILKKEFERLDKIEKTFIGYPCDAKFDYSPLYKFLKFPLNNVGDPFESSTYRLQTKTFEREVLKFFADFFHLKDYWGYVNNGGTEGNLYGLYAAREHLPGAVVFFSEHTHYSIKKNVHILGLKNCIIKSQENGEMDYADFEEKIKGNANAIVVVNIGSTMTGAIDKVEIITEILERNNINYYIHADAALYGMIAPILDPKIKFDFKTKINSLAVSGHKFIGSPIPCGVVLIRKKFFKSLRNYVEYIHTNDTTLSGSRDGFTPLILWYRIKSLGLRGFKKQIIYCKDIADFLVKELNAIGYPGVKQSFVTVWFKRPSDKIIKKWDLAANEKIAHVICMPHETKKMLREFVCDMKKEINRK